MCGFLGAFALHQLEKPELAKMRVAAQRLAHRGNSSQGELLEKNSALFHHRLAFRDLKEGRQPMTDKQKRATILFNGELYDFRALRDELARDYEFQSRSDTEVILAAYLVQGPEKFLQSFDGEFAFVIQDHRDGRLFAARDPFGVKPLFFSAADDTPADLLRGYKQKYDFPLKGDLQFASEMKGLAHPLRWEKRGLDRLFLSLYEEMGTSFAGVYALAPGSLFTATPRAEEWHCSIERRVPKGRSRKAKHDVSFETRAKELKELIGETVQSKLDSDVPLGAYLSGGIDSRIAAWEMGKTGAVIETFTVGFEGGDYDETEQVRQFLRAYPNLRGRALRTTNESLEYAYAHAIYASEIVQPYTNGSAKWWLSRFARRHVRGVLTGDGSDELFCGYPSYRYLAWWKFAQRQPSSQARASLYANRVVGAQEKFWEKGLSSRPDGHDLEESVKTLGWAHPLFAQIKSQSQFWVGKATPALLAQEKPDLLSYISPGSPLSQWQDYFLHTHFPTHVLNWVGDRMEMANTLEGRPIFLSRKILDFVRELPDNYLVRGMRDKAVLRKAYAPVLGDFAASPKKQFNAPFLVDGPLGAEFLSPPALRASGLIDPVLVAKAFIARDSAKDGLEQSFARIFLQNCLVAQMLDRYLVRGQAPERNLAWEEKFLDERTVDLCSS